MAIFSGIGTAVGTYFGGPAGAGCGGAIGGVLDGLLARNDQQTANDVNVQQAQKQMDFQERMSNTSYQRAVQDMQAAGLNPMLAYSQGGASVPSGSTAHVDPKWQADISSAKQSADMSSAFSSMSMTAAQVENVQAQTAKIKSETLEQSLNSARALAELNLTWANEDNTRALWRTNSAESRRRQLQLDEESKGGSGGNAFSADVVRRKAEATSAQLGLSADKANSNYYEGFGKMNPYLRNLLDILRGITGASGAIGGRR